MVIRRRKSPWTAENERIKVKELIWRPKTKKIIVLLSVALLCLTPLFADDIFGAISRGNLKAVKSYIEVLGVSVDTKGQNDDSLFGSLIEQYYDFGDPTKLNQYINVAKYLYDKGAFVNADYNLLLSQRGVSEYPFFEAICNDMGNLSNILIIEKDMVLGVPTVDGSINLLDAYLVIHTDDFGYTGETELIPDPRYIIYFAKTAPYLGDASELLNIGKRHSGWFTTADANQSIDKDASSDSYKTNWIHEREASPVVLAYYAMAGNLDKVKELLKAGVDSNLAILASIVGDNLMVVKFFDDLGQVTPAFVEKSLNFNLSPSMKAYLKEYIPKSK